MPTFHVGDHAIAHAMIGGVEVTKPCEIIEVGPDYLVAQAGQLRQYFPISGVIGTPGQHGYYWLVPTNQPQAA